MHRGMEVYVCVNVVRFTSSMSVYLKSVEMSLKLCRRRFHVGLLIRLNFVCNSFKKACHVTDQSVFCTKKSTFLVFNGVIFWPEQLLTCRTQRRIYFVTCRRTDCCELPVDDPAVNNLEDNNPLRTVFQEVGHLLLQLGLHLMLGYHFQVVPWGFAAPLHLTQVLLQLVEIHLTEEMVVQVSELWWETVLKNKM